MVTSEAEHVEVHHGAFFAAVHIVFPVVLFLEIVGRIVEPRTKIFVIIGHLSRPSFGRESFVLEAAIKQSGSGIDVTPAEIHAGTCHFGFNGRRSFRTTECRCGYGCQRKQCQRSHNRVVNMFHTYKELV